MRFHDLRLAEPVVRAATEQGYTTPTPIQLKAIPVVLGGHDVLGCAQTGTGKTGAFALPILQRLAGSAGADGRKGPGRACAGKPRALVLCPTRELATQIFESFKAYGRHLPLRHAAVFGGVSQAGQVRAMRAGIDVLVATPGRLLDLMNQGLVDLSSVEMLVLDEADRMLDMGFIRDIRRIIERLPSGRQTLLFSATMPAEIHRLARAILREPVLVQAEPVSSTARALVQSVYLVGKGNKPVLLEQLLCEGSMDRTLVFTRTKHGADKLVSFLRRSGIEAAAIHGNKTQGARTRALAEFKSAKTHVLVATDIASRGIDVEGITHVVNFDLPVDPETYIHRIGRTARAGASGIALSFCDEEELGNLRAIERLVGERLQVAQDDLDIAREARGVRGEGSGGHGPKRRSTVRVRRDKRRTPTGRPSQSAGPDRRPGRMRKSDLGPASARGPGERSRQFP